MGSFMPITEKDRDILKGMSIRYGTFEVVKALAQIAERATADYGPGAVIHNDSRMLNTVVEHMTQAHPLRALAAASGDESDYAGK